MAIARCEMSGRRQIALGMVLLVGSAYCCAVFLRVESSHWGKTARCFDGHIRLPATRIHSPIGSSWLDA